MKNLLIKIPNPELRNLAAAVTDGKRLTPAEALTLYRNADLSLMALLATTVKRKKSGDAVYFNRNFHIEPTNICIYNCRFCSYHKAEGDPGSWEMTENEILDAVRHFDGIPVTEVHITGGVHPS
ncbi:MAG TPA: aminofutalosine synthase MqnE, partial [Bacteroidales bacterium]|nr:aminofutalosine synthase MqnE [Bacteroidales bacterium]